MSMLNLRKNQSGLVSIMVTMMFISIITLVTVSFAFLMRREQRQVLDRQLSTQAFYAAESAIADTVSALKEGDIRGDIDDCEAFNSDSPEDRVLDGPGGVITYSCVLVNQEPTSLEYGNIDSEPKTIRIEAADGKHIDSVNISWHSTVAAPENDSDTFFAVNNHHDLPTKAFYESRSTDGRGADNCTDGPNVASFANKTAVLRADIIPVTGTVNRSTITGNTQSMFLYPKCAGVGQEGVHPYLTSSDADSQTNQGQIVDGQCNTANKPRYCNVSIDGLDDRLNTSVVYLRLYSIYQSADVSISAKSASGQQLELMGSQAVIDATGRANDVLRRVQVRVPLEEEFSGPRAVLETIDSICKRLRSRPGNTELSPATLGNEPGCSLDRN